MSESTRLAELARSLEEPGASAPNIQAQLRAIRAALRESLKQAASGGIDREDILPVFRSSTSASSYTDLIARDRGFDCRRASSEAQIEQALWAIRQLEEAATVARSLLQLLDRVSMNRPWHLPGFDRLLKDVAATEARITSLARDIEGARQFYLGNRATDAKSEMAALQARVDELTRRLAETGQMEPPGQQHPHNSECHSPQPTPGAAPSKEHGGDRAGR